MIVQRFYFKWFYIRNHLRILLRHLTVRRAANLLLNQCEYILRRQRLLSYPGFLKIDPSNRCQLRCPGCGQASDEFRSALPSKGFLTPAEFKKIVDPLAPTTLGISLSALGEPLLNKTIVAMIEYAHSLNVGVTISTNLAMKLSEETLQGLVKSGLDKLMVSLDGATSETYRQYRVGGNFELVRENVKRLAAIKDQLGSRTPEIQWKFIEFEHNRSEVSVVPSLYRKWGFDSYRIDFDRKDTRVEDVARSRYARKESCFWLYSTIAVDVDGTVQPCCSFRLSTDWHLGDALVSDIRLLWNSPAYQSLRKGFGRVNYGGSMHPTCRLCFSGEPRRPEALASTP